MWHVIAHPYPNLKSSLGKPLTNKGMDEWIHVINIQALIWIDFC